MRQRRASGEHATVGRDNERVRRVKCGPLPAAGYADHRGEGLVEVPEEGEDGLDPLVPEDEESEGV
jgi:hypothetical protein